MNPLSIYWLRSDLRLADNPALCAALARGGPVVPVFIWAPEEEAPWSPGGASQWWLHQSLAALSEQFRALGSRLIIRRAAGVVLGRTYPHPVVSHAVAREVALEALASLKANGEDTISVADR
jgi:deoxyribodipyrimidine photo-lyase